MSMRRMFTAIAAAAIVILMAGCSRGPDEAALRSEVQTQLDQHFKRGLLELTSLKRQGSAPLAAGADGAPRLIVYYNATLRLREGYDFNDWEGLSPASLAQALGATEQGISGIKAERNKPGDTLRVYGTATYERSGGAWRNVAAATRDVAAAPADPGSAAPTRDSKRFLDQLAAMLEIPPPGISARDERIISEELSGAIRAITRRRAREHRVYAFASGPPGGEYVRVADAIVSGIAAANTRVKLRTIESEGSVDNVQLLARGEADYAIVQSDVAALAAAGAGPFAGSGHMTALAALGSLYPEPVHVVVSAQSGIRSVGDLRGKRVDLGAPRSGTRIDALATLAAHGVPVEALAQARDEGPQRALQRLRAGEIDAVFSTIGAPGRDLQSVAASHPIRVLSLASSAIDRLLAEHSGMIRLTLPPNTYPGQTEPIATVAPTALLVSTTNAPNDEVEAILKLVFEQTDFAAAGSMQGVKIAKRTGLRGVAIPLHPGAAAYFGTAPAASKRP